MRIINGRKIADKILISLKGEIQEKKLRPHLAVILIGKNPLSKFYIHLKEKTGQEIGVKVKKYVFSEKISEKKVCQTIKELNQDEKTDGILVQLPLPKRFLPDKIIPLISPKKDVDGFLPQSQFNPPFISAIWQALAYTREELKNKKIISLVNSEIFGKKLQLFFKKQSLKLDYYVHSVNSMEQIKNADVVITALGLSNYIKASMIKRNCILIDGGISKVKNQTIGDIDQEDVRKKAKWLSPVPGGVGPVTVACLLKNTVEAFKNRV